MYIATLKHWPPQTLTITGKALGSHKHLGGEYDKHSDRSGAGFETGHVIFHAAAKSDF